MFAGFQQKVSGDTYADFTESLLRLTILVVIPKLRGGISGLMIVDGQRSGLEVPILSLCQDLPMIAWE